MSLILRVVIANFQCTMKHFYMQTLKIKCTAVAHILIIIYQFACTPAVEAVPMACMQLFKLMLSRAYRLLKEKPLML